MSMQPIIPALDALAERMSSHPRPGDSYRVFHGRGQCYPGLEFVAIDWFDPLLLVTLFREPPAVWLSDLEQLLRRHRTFAGADSVLVQHRYQAGAPMQIIKQDLDGTALAKRRELQFHLSPAEHQNMGFFLDMEPGRAWLETLCAGKRVLNLFAYTCAFSVVAVAAGATAVVNVDMSRSALARGRANHRLNGLPLDGVKFLAENILKSWSRIRRPGPYEVVIFDPPSFQRGSFVAQKDYAKLVRRLPELLPLGGDVLACLNAPELDSRFIHQVFSDQCPAAVYVQRLAQNPDFPDAEPERALKLLHFRCPPSSVVSED